MRDSAEAKDLGRLEAGEDGVCGSLLAGSDICPCLENAKGLLEFVENDVENGLFEVLDANVLTEVDVELENELSPNNFSPRLMKGVEACASALVATDFQSLPVKTACEILTPRRALTLPSLRRQIFLLHASTYSRLSCPGRCSGRSPFNCRSNTIRSLQTLHFASVAEGGVVGSSHD